MDICCECKIQQGIGNQKIVWYVPPRREKKKKNIDTSLSSIISVNSSNIFNNKSYISLPKAKLDISHFRTKTGSSADLSLPSKIQDQSTLSIQNVKQLKRQNNQYVEIIKQQLVPLKKDYQCLLQKYKQKESLVNLMSNRLIQIESQYFGQKQNLCKPNTQKYKNITSKSKILKKANRI